MKNQAKNKSIGLTEANFLDFSQARKMKISYPDGIVQITCPVSKEETSNWLRLPKP